MKRAILLSVLTVLTISILGHAGDAHAGKKTTFAILTAVGCSLFVAGTALTAYGGWEYQQAPVADTLMQYQRYQREYNYFLEAGIATMIVTVPLIGLLGWGLDRAITEEDREQRGRKEREDRRRFPVSGLWLAPSGTGMALGGRF